jgi:hypothetical protein
VTIRALINLEARNSKSSQMNPRGVRWTLLISPQARRQTEAIAFRLSGRIGDAECAITREALEVHFWLSVGADASRMLWTFVDGRNRIVAVAERKMRARPGQPVRLNSHDFSAKRSADLNPRTATFQTRSRPRSQSPIGKSKHKSTTVQMLIISFMSNCVGILTILHPRCLS